MQLRLSWLGRLAGILGVSAVVAAPAARAQGGDGFLFRRPPSTLALRFGYDQASAQSDLFTFVTDQLTLRRGDFSSLTIAGDLAGRLSDRVDLVFGAAFAKRGNRSEFRDWLDQDDLPIEQRTTFQRLPLTVGLRAFVKPRGRAVGQLAWVPAARSFYVGGGAGAMWYRFRQAGDFVDFETLDVFRDQFDSSGWTFTAYGLAGMEMSLGTRFFLTGEARYTWARSTLADAYKGFDRIDLSGLALTAGIGIRQ